MNKHALFFSMLAAATFTGTTVAQSGDKADLTVKQSSQFGNYVADASGRPLYMFTSDTQGQGSSQAKSSCQDQCAKAWPPLTVQGQPQVGSELQQDLVSTLQRQDGQMQVTYGGWPLYYFAKDKGGSDAVEGQDVHGFGGEWYLVSPDGSKNEKKQQQ